MLNNGEPNHPLLLPSQANVSPTPVSVELRVRGAWEATDLGIQMLRDNAKLIWWQWFRLSYPITFLIGFLGLLLENMAISFVLLWWIKPLFDRPVLFVLSRRLFGQTPTPAEVWNASWTFGGKRILRWLLWLRFSPHRSVTMPVDLLEQLSGSRRRARSSVIASASATVGFWTTQICLLFEQCLVIGAIIFAGMFIPVEFLPDKLRETWEALEFGLPLWADALIFAVYYLSISFIEPFFVAAGFGLYVNSRVKLEAWDLEIEFRKLAKRIAENPLTFAMVMLIAFSVSSVSAAPNFPSEQATLHVSVSDEWKKKPNSNEAANVEAPSPAEQASELNANEGLAAGAELSDWFEAEGGAKAKAEAWQKSLHQAFHGPEISPKRTITTWEPKNPPKAKPQEALKESASWNWLGNFLGASAEYALWILGFLALVLISSFLLRNMPARLAKKAKKAAQLDAVEIALPETLPDDYLQQAERFFGAGDARRALALLYRALLTHVNQRSGDRLPRGCTEAECLRQITALQDADLLNVAKPLVQTWQQMAYARRAPAASQFDALVQRVRASQLAAVRDEASSISPEPGQIDRRSV